MLDVKRLRVLREVASCGSFSAAAEALAYTQSAVSQQIAALEKEAGARLVDRAARGVTLTQAGAALVAHADAILSRLDDAEAELAAINGLRGGRVRMTTFATAGATIVPAAIVEYRRRYPGVELQLEPAEPVDGLEALRAGRIDIALTTGMVNDPMTANAPDLERHDLADDPMFLMLPTDHPLAGRDALAVEELSDDDWILGSTDRCPDAHLLMRTCRDAGFDPRIAFFTDDHLATQGFVAGGFGVAFIPRLALVAVRDDVVVRPIIGATPARRIRACTLVGSWNSPAKQAMIEVLAEVAQSYAVDTGQFTVRPAAV